MYTLISMSVDRHTCKLAHIQVTGISYDFTLMYAYLYIYIYACMHTYEYM